MTEKQLQQLLALWQPRLGLAHWDIILTVEPCSNETNFMEIRRSTTYDAAQILVNPWVLTGEFPEKVLTLPLTEERVEAKLVHELLHCCTARMNWAATEFVEGHLHRDAYSIYTQAWDTAEENAIEELARALIRSWPRG